MRVLVVDDSEGLRKVLAALLISAGHETVASLADGNGVEEIVRASGPISSSSTTSCRAATGWKSSRRSTRSRPRSTCCS